MNCRGSMAGRFPMRAVFRIVLAALAASAALAGCETNNEQSQIAVSLMDAPPKGVTSFTVFVQSVGIHVDDMATAVSDDPAAIALDVDDKWVNIAVNRAIDLAALQTETSAELLGSAALPDGKINQFRVLIDASQPAQIKAVTGDCTASLAKFKTGWKVSQPFKPFHVGKNLQHAVTLEVPLDELLVPGTANKACWDVRQALKVRKFQTGGKNVAVD